MSISVDALPTLGHVPELKPLLDHKTDKDFVRRYGGVVVPGQRGGQRELDPGLYATLPFEDMDWPTTVDEYIDFLVRFVFWIPQQSTNPVWAAPINPQGEHQEVHDHLCFFFFFFLHYYYWLIDQPVLPDDGFLQRYGWFDEFLVGYAKVCGAFLDTPESFNDKMLDTFINESPRFRVEDSMIGNPPRPNAPSGWLTFNQFLARELNPGLRPIAKASDNTTATAPADCTYRTTYKVDADSNIEPRITITGTHTYANVKDLPKGIPYADSFANGYFIHLLFWVRTRTTRSIRPWPGS